MKFGYFDDKAKEYVITTPHTPLPWINYLGSNDFFSLISNTCGGYSFYKDAKLLRITRYRYNNIPADSNGKYYYINDDGVIWNPGTMPSATETDTYECRHGLGYSRFCSSKNNLKADRWTIMIPTEMLFWEQETGMLFQKLYVRKNAVTLLQADGIPLLHIR